MKPVIVNEHATIKYGILKGQVGFVQGYDYDEDLVEVYIDEHTTVLVNSVCIEQEHKDGKENVL